MAEQLQNTLNTLRSEKSKLISELTHCIAPLQNEESLGSNDVEEIERMFRDLVDKLNEVGNIAKNMTQPVSQLETRKRRLTLLLGKVNDIIELKNNLALLKDAISRNNIEHAVIYCGKLNSIKDAIQVNLAELQEFEVLKETVVNEVKKGFGEAVAEGDPAGLQKYAKYFSPLGLGNEGVDKYITHIVTNLQSKGQATIDLLLSPESEGANKFEEALVKLLRSVVTAYEKHCEPIAKEFGNEGHLKLLQNLQILIDQLAGQILDGFTREKQVKFKAEQLKRRDESANIDYKEVSKLADEIARIIQHGESFENYINNAGKIIISKLSSFSLPESDKIRWREDTGLLRVSSFKGRLQELADAYISLESVFMMKSIKKAINSLDLRAITQDCYLSKEVLNSKPFSDIIDEIFFILQKGSQRALVTYNIDIICAVVNHITAILQEEIIDELSRRASACSRGQFGFQSVGLGNSFSQANAGFIICLNMLEMSRVYIKQLSDEISMTFKRLFGQSHGGETRMFSHCINSMSELYDKVKRLIQEQLKFLFRTLHPAYAGLLNNLHTISYDLTEEKFAEYEINDPFALKFITDLKKVLKQWKTQMVTENWDIFIDYTTASIAEHIENILKNSGKKINDLGALQLEKDVREIQKQVQSLTNNSIRSRFIKLRQVSQILSSGSREEVQRLFMQDDWKLTANDTRLIYSLKSSVRREEAASLLLQK
jgi:hypothetical protein